MPDSHEMVVRVPESFTSPETIVGDAKLNKRATSTLVS